MITHFTILGERCSGTNFLAQAILENFNLKITWDYGWKHFFGFEDYKDCDHVLFLGIYRDAVDWINSFYRNPWHLRPALKNSPDAFLNKAFWSLDRTTGQSELMADRNILNGEHYKNIFEARKVKTTFLITEMPKKVKHYTVIRYESLRDDYNVVLTILRSMFDLSITKKYITPILYYKDQSQFPYTKTQQSRPCFNSRYEYIEPFKIMQHPDFDKDFERSIGYEC